MNTLEEVKEFGTRGTKDEKEKKIIELAIDTAYLMGRELELAKANKELREIAELFKK